MRQVNLRNEEVTDLCIKFIDNPNLRVESNCFGTSYCMDESADWSIGINDLASTVFWLTLGRQDDFIKFIKIEALAAKVIELEQMAEEELAKANIITRLFRAILNFLICNCSCYFRSYALSELSMHVNSFYSAISKEYIEAQLLERFPPSCYDSSNNDALYLPKDTLEIYQELSACNFVSSAK